MDVDAADDHAVLLWNCCSDLCVVQRGVVRGLDADAADDDAVPGWRRIAVGSRIKPQQHVFVTLHCVQLMSRTPLDGWLFQFMVTVMKKSVWSLERLSVAENILWLLLLGSRAQLVCCIVALLCGWLARRMLRWSGSVLL